MPNENNFPKGLYYKLPNEKAPDFVKGKISIKLTEAIEYLTGLSIQGQDYLNLDIKVSKAGKGYLQIDDWKPNKGGGQQQPGPQQTGPQMDAQAQQQYNDADNPFA